MNTDDPPEDLEERPPDPPISSSEVDPEARVDLGYMEDREDERDVEEMRAPVRGGVEDPLREAAEDEDRL